MLKLSKEVICQNIRLSLYNCLFLTVAPRTGNWIRLRAHPPAFLGPEKRKGREAPTGGCGLHQGHQEMRQDRLKTILRKYPTKNI